MKHLRDLWSMYESAIRAKRASHAVVDACLRAAISITRIHQRWQHYVAHTQEIYHAAKQDALTSYMDSTTVVGLHPRYRKQLHHSQIYQNRWLGYTQQIYHHALHWTQRLDMQTCHKFMGVCIIHEHTRRSGLFFCTHVACRTALLTYSPQHATCSLLPTRVSPLGKHVQGGLFLQNPAP